MVVCIGNAPMPCLRERHVLLLDEHTTKNQICIFDAIANTVHSHLESIYFSSGSVGHQRLLRLHSSTHEKFGPLE